MTTADNDKMNVITECLPDTKHRLDSWKAIALYVNREVRTAQRWEKHEGLPVHRQVHRKGKTVYAFKCEIDAWFRSRRFDRNVATCSFGIIGFPGHQGIAVGSSGQTEKTVSTDCLDSRSRTPFGVGL